MTTAVMMRPSAGSIPLDEAAARREGWLISGCGVDDGGRRRIELQCLDDPEPGEGTLPDDLDAWRHVAALARQGSPLHLQALALVDPIERALIERHAGRP